MNLQSRILANPRLRRYRGSDTEDYMQITLTILLVVIFLAFAIRPSIATAFRLSKQISESEQLDEQLTTKILSMREVRSNYKEIASTIHLLDETVPIGIHDGELLTNLTNVGAESGTIITSVNFSQTRSTPTNTLGMDMKIIGSYESVKMFLNATNNLLRIITVDAITLEQDSRYLKDRIGMSMQAEAYYYQN